MADGIFLGGLAKGIESGRAGARATRGLDLTERSLGLQEEQARNAQQRDLAAKVDAGIANAMKDISGIVKAGLGAGRSPEMISKTIKPLLDNVTGLARRAGRDPEALTVQAQAMIQGPSVQETAIAQATGETKGKIAAAEAVVAAQPDVTRTQALQAQGLIPKTGQKLPDVQNFMKPSTGEIVAIDRTQPGAANAIQDLVNQGAFRISTSIQAASKEDLTPQPSKQSINDFIQAETAARNIVTVTGRLRQQVKDGAVTAKMTGGLIRGLSNAAGEMVQFSRSLGFEDTALLDPKNYKLSGFGAEAASSAAFRSNVINLSYMMARAAEPGGRLNEGDIQRSADRLAANAGDQGQFLAALDEIDSSTKAEFRNFRLSTGRFVPNLPEIPDELKVKEADPTEPKPTEPGTQKKISPKAADNEIGTEGTSKGVKYVVRMVNGVKQWVPIQ